MDQLQVDRLWNDSPTFREYVKETERRMLSKEATIKRLSDTIKRLEDTIKRQHNLLSKAMHATDPDCMHEEPDPNGSMVGKTTFHIETGYLTQLHFEIASELGRK